VRRGRAPVKVLGDGELSKALEVSAHAFSASARAKIEASGGTATVVSGAGPSGTGPVVAQA
jgi:large subunit ribosomal protein L15